MKTVKIRKEQTKMDIIETFRGIIEQIVKFFQDVIASIRGFNDQKPTDPSKEDTNA